MELSGGSIVTSFQSISHAARSWLGSSHGHTYKCIIDGNDPRASALVGDLRSYLLAVNSDPTATGLLLETLETVERSAGSGHAWTTVLAGLLLERLHNLSTYGGVPLTHVLAVMHEALGACKEVFTHASIAVDDVVGSYPLVELQAYWEWAVGKRPEYPGVNSSADDVISPGRRQSQQTAAAEQSILPSASPSPIPRDRPPPSPSPWTPPDTLAHVLKTGSCKTGSCKVSVNATVVDIGGEDEFGWFDDEADFRAAPDDRDPSLIKDGQGAFPPKAKEWESEATVTLITPFPKRSEQATMIKESPSAALDLEQRLLSLGQTALGRSDLPGRENHGEEDGCDWFFDGPSSSDGQIIPLDVLRALGSMLAGSVEEPSSTFPTTQSKAASDSTLLATPLLAASDSTLLATPDLDPEARRLAALAISLQGGHVEESRLATSLLDCLCRPPASDQHQARDSPQWGRRAALVREGIGWESHVIVKQLPGLPQSLSWVVPGACVVLEESEAQQLMRMQDLCGEGEAAGDRSIGGRKGEAAGDRSIGGRKANVQCCPTPGRSFAPSGTPPALPRRGLSEGEVVSLAVFLDGPLLRPRQDPPPRRCGGTAKAASGPLPSASEAARDVLTAPSRSDQAACDAILRWMCPQHSRRTPADGDVHGPPLLLICSGHAPRRIVGLLNEDRRVVVLQGLGSRAVRAAAASCGAVLYGSEPWVWDEWQRQSLECGEGGHFERQAGRAADLCPVLWWCYEGGREGDPTSATYNGGGSRRVQSDGATGSQARLLVLQRLHCEAAGSVERPELGSPPPSSGGSAANLATRPTSSSPCCTVLLHAPVSATVAASEVALRESFHRIKSSYLRGRVLPGGGVCELMCAAWLRQMAPRGTEADAPSRRQDSDLRAHTSEHHNSDEACVPAWKRVNRSAAEFRAVFRAAVFEAVAGALDDLAMIMLQNDGLTYAQAADAVSACSFTLQRQGWCCDKTAPPSQQRIIGRLSAAACRAAQLCMTLPESIMAAGPSGLEHAARGRLREPRAGLPLQPDSDPPAAAWGHAAAGGRGGLQVDDVASREVGIAACGHLVDLMLRCDVKIANHARA